MVQQIESYRQYLPNAVQDSGSILLVAGAGWTQIFAAILFQTVWGQIINHFTAPGINVIGLAYGAAGFEVAVLVWDQPIAGGVFPPILINGPLTIPIGTRISMQATLVNATVQVHAFHT